MSKYKIGDIVKGKVTGIEKYGIFLLMDDGYTGLIHISEISEKFVRNVFDYVQLDEIIISKIIEVDESSKRLKLTIKNFDYRIEDSKENEDQGGFALLREKLPEWISEYKNKIEK
jgi:general stress protein 13